MESQLLEEHDRAHFMTRRFDREGGGVRHHIQTLCAIQHFDYNHVGSYSYEQLFQTMRQLKLSYLEAEQLYRRMVFNVLAKNCDDHTKNFAFILKEDGAWRLAPAYDICHAYSPNSSWVSRHALSINGKRDGITDYDFEAIAKLVNIRQYKKIVTQIKDVVSRWNSFADTVNLSADLRDSISSTI